MRLAVQDTTGRVGIQVRRHLERACTFRADWPDAADVTQVRVFGTPANALTIATWPGHEDTSLLIRDRVRERWTR